ncbi:Hypothetical protein AJAP_40230 [Amycolatopsis japonica]|uniref:GmrSD restriction endonucleases N-terminal domain-containing protein n=1 Tax=Amycolatopsis japonica TaxID=208439 RepID=A0A075V8J7_9PSEU|nr:DUF262 domain-containing protein [Amycolatopsis japonica]AIG80824.1 Hypothetical protein AJAP_40230 [Amycolatopsis japonica]
MTDYPQQFLEVAHQTVSWFWGRLQNKELNIRPPFQRNPVWQDRQKAYLIDSILRGFPVPELYLQSTVTSGGDEVHTIVDGQQRVRACLEFISNKFALGEESDELAGLKFDQLPDAQRRKFFEYKFVVRSLPALSTDLVRDIFARLNRNNIALNKQELRHATYWGEFITCMESLSQMHFWVNSGIFSSNDFRRMIDVEYVSELATGMLFGPQNKKSNLDKFYASFEEEFPDQDKVEDTFNAVLGELEQLVTWPNKLRWSRKVDFYSLFIVLAARASEMPFDRDERERISRRLVEFSAQVNSLVSLVDKKSHKNFEVDTSVLSYSRAIRNSSDLSSRRTRQVALDAYLRGRPISFEPAPAKHRDPLRSLPATEVLMASIGDSNTGSSLLDG